MIIRRIPGNTNPSLARPPLVGGQTRPQNSIPNPVPGGSPLIINGYQIFTFDLTNTFQPRLIQAIGTTFFVHYASANTALAIVEFETNTGAGQIAALIGGGTDLLSGKLIQIYPTFKFDGWPYSQFYISNVVAQAGVTISIFSTADANQLLEVES